MKTGVQKKEIHRRRESFLDVLRIAATLAVVLLHTVTGIMDAADMNLYPLEKKVFLIALDLITWCVPIFVLISGYLFLNPDREIPFGQMLTKYCRRIALALLLFGVPYAVLELAAGERRFRIGMLWESVLMVLQGKTWSHMWYLYMIFFLYLIMPGLKALLKKLPKGALYLILALLFTGSSLLPFFKKLFALQWLPVLPDGCIYLFYYLCGYLFAAGNVEERGGRRQKQPEWASRNRLRLCGAVLLLLLFGGMAASRIVGSYRVQMAYNYPFTVAASLLLMWLLGEGEDKIPEKNRTPLQKAGALCFGVYLVHPVFANIYYKFLCITPLNFPQGDFLQGGDIPRIAVSLPLFFLLILLPAVFTAWGLYKIPLLRKYVL